MRYNGILFDLDGTLLDTSELIIKSFQHTVNRHYNKAADVGIVKEYFGRPLRAALEQLGPDKVEEMLQTYREYNLLYHDQLAKVFSGVAQTVAELFDAGIALGIVTSKTQATALRGLRLFDLDKFFPVLIGLEQCSNHKPHPQPVELALAALGLPAGECLMVGDSPNDILSARAAGVKTVAVRWSEGPWEQILAAEPDYVIESMSELTGLCGLRQT